MDKKVAGLVGAVSAVALLDTAHAATISRVTEVMRPGSFEDLLEPIPNALALLRAVDAAEANVARTYREPQRDPNVKLAQYDGYGGYYHHHHHHHHHRWHPYLPYYPYYHRHHHHHHHHHYHNDNE
jgi:hypothetical protein